MSVIKALHEKVQSAEAEAKQLPIQKRRKITLAVIAVCLVLLAVFGLFFMRWRDVTFVVSDKKICSELANRGFQLGAGDASGGCRVEHVSVDAISAVNILGAKYKANQGARAFDIEKGLVSVEH